METESTLEMAGRWGITYHGNIKFQLNKMNELPRSAGHHCCLQSMILIVHINICSEGRTHFKCPCHNKSKIKKEGVRNIARPDSEALGVLLCPVSHRHPPAPRVLVQGAVLSLEV